MHIEAPLVPAMIDVDHFKKFSDKHGHESRGGARREELNSLPRVFAGDRGLCRSQRRLSLVRIDESFELWARAEIEYEADLNFRRAQVVQQLPLVRRNNRSSNLNLHDYRAFDHEICVELPSDRSAEMHFYWNFPLRLKPHVQEGKSKRLDVDGLEKSSPQLVVYVEERNENPPSQFLMKHAEQWRR
jgi:hypothetical protein